ncbi:MAG: hypothetical protein ACLP1X_23995 [Polyangiaceae bacterium]|jgi:hypothetical protein
MNEASGDEPAANDLEAWVLRDDALRARARVFAAKLGRDEEGIYRTLRNFQRSASERLRLGLRHGRLHPDHR